MLSRLNSRIDLRDESGQSAVEFGLMVPFLFLLVIMIFQFGTAFNRWNNATQVAASGARLAAVNKTGAESTNPTMTLAGNLCTQIASKDNATPPTITITRDAATLGTPVHVSVTNPYTFDVPLLGDIVNAVRGKKTFDLKGSATMRAESPTTSDTTKVVGTSSCTA